MNATHIDHEPDCPVCNREWVPDTSARLYVAERFAQWLDTEDHNYGTVWRESVAAWLRPRLGEPSVMTMLAEHPTVAAWVAESPGVAA